MTDQEIEDSLKRIVDKDTPIYCAILDLIAKIKKDTVEEIEDKHSQEQWQREMMDSIYKD